MAGWLVRLWSMDDPSFERFIAVNVEEPKLALAEAHDALSPPREQRLTTVRVLSDTELSRLSPAKGSVTPVTDRSIVGD